VILRFVVSFWHPIDIFCLSFTDTPFVIIWLMFDIDSGSIISVFVIPSYPVYFAYQLERLPIIKNRGFNFSSQ
jgi:hypothetical protein